MQDLQFDFFDVPSPCRGVCTSDDKGNCHGCFRTREERFGWKELSNNDKQRVIKLCLQREKRKNAPIKIKVIEDDVAHLQPSLLDPPINHKIDTQVDESDFEDFEL